jgi:predicted HTH domain antitoxin
MPHETIELSLGSTHSTTLQAWEDGDISLGKMAELLGVDKNELRGVLSDMNLPIINTDAQEAVNEANRLIKSLES